MIFYLSVGDEDRLVLDSQPRGEVIMELEAEPHWMPDTDRDKPPDLSAWQVARERINPEAMGFRHAYPPGGWYPN